MLVHHCVQGTPHSVPSPVEKVATPPHESTSKRTVLGRERRRLSRSIAHKYAKDKQPVAVQVKRGWLRVYLQLPVEGDNLNSDSPVCRSRLPARRSPPRRWSDGGTHQPWLEGGVGTRGQP